MTVTTTKDSDSENKPEVFCTIKGQRKEEAKDASGTVTVKYYYFKVGCQLASDFLFLNPIILLHSLLPRIACVYSRTYSATGFLLENVLLV